MHTSRFHINNRLLLLVWLTAVLLSCNGGKKQNREEKTVSLSVQKKDTTSTHNTEKKGTGKRLRTTTISTIPIPVTLKTAGKRVRDSSKQDSTSLCTTCTLSVTADDWRLCVYRGGKKTE